MVKLFLRATLALLLTAVCARAVPVSLRVVDANNKPVAGASVETVGYAGEPKLIVRAQTAADGTLALDLRGVADEAAPSKYAWTAKLFWAARACATTSWAMEPRCYLLAITR